MPRKKRADSSASLSEPAEKLPVAELPTRDRLAQAPRLKIVGLNAPEPRVSEGALSEEHRAGKPTRSDHDRLGDPYFRRSTRLLDFLLAVVLLVGAFFSVALTYRGIGHSWDEALYLRPAASAGQWVLDLARGDTAMLEPSAIDQAWGLEVTGNDPLHPEVAPIPKAVIGLGLTILSGYGIPEMIAMRLPIAVVFALTVALLYILGARTYGRLPGFLGAVGYWLMPRVFGHAHLAASETLFAFTLVLLAWSYLGAIKHPWMAVFTAIAYALAFDTKVTALFLPPALLIWGQLYYRRDYASNIFAMALGSPLVAFALWPWLWWDPLVRIAEYVKFYATHQHTAVFYMGRMWGYIYGPPAPWHYPFVITAIAVPTWTLVLIVFGVVATCLQCRKRPVPMFYFFIAATIIGVCALPNAPKYDGERLFFGAFPFLALLAGGGFAWVWSHLERWRQNGHALLRWASMFWRLLAFVMIGWNIRTLAKVHPDELNFFNVLIGGAKGAYEKGFETAYWGEAVNEDVIDYVNSLTKPGTKFKPLALNELVFLNLQGWGLLSEDGIYVAANEPFDYYILQVRQGFFGNRERALHFGAKPLRVFEGQGVPKIEIFSGDALTTRGLVTARSPQALSQPSRATEDEMHLLTESTDTGASSTRSRIARAEEGQTTAVSAAAAAPIVTTSSTLATSHSLEQLSRQTETTTPPTQHATTPPPPLPSPKETPHATDEMQFAL
ncbi:MAG: glycosyltransferase family 39 protein [Candidatus Sumerlaeaceae bacterium]